MRECSGTDTTDAETHLRRQVTQINSAYTWSVRAQQWVEWLSRMSVPQAYQCLIQGKYTQAVALYEQAIEACPAQQSVVPADRPE